MFLFIGFAWGQTNLDKLVLKDGTEYVGEYSHFEGGIVYFKPQKSFGLQPISVKRVKKLELKDGQIIIDGGKVKNSLALEEYQKLSTKEKAVHDANLVNMWRWAFYGPLSGVTIAGFMFLAQGEAWEEDVSIPASLAISYLILNLKKVEFSYPESLANEYDRLYYKKVYSKKLKKRKFKYIVGSTIVTGAVVVGIFFATFSLDGYDACFDPKCG